MAHVDTAHVKTGKHPRALDRAGSAPRARRIRIGPAGLWLAGLACLCFLTSCAAAPSVLAPRGPAAQSIANLWWILLAVGMAVYVAVMGFLFFALIRRRSPDLALRTPAPRSRVQVVVWAGLIVPGLILLGVHGLTLGVLRILAEPETPPALTVQVIGHQWWWEVRYPEYNIETANEIHIPAGQPVEIVLISDDVIHSFWVPELHGKLDLNPGFTNRMWLQADVPGAYWGECAEFGGVQHAKMQFVVVAEPVDEFAAWVQQQRRPAQVPAEPQAQRGLDVFLGSECIYCHTVAGTGATGNLGPDLTHLASRRTLAAGSVANNRGNLAGWITDPQHIKPGSLMPPTDLTGTDLQALLAYLATLE